MRPTKLTISAFGPYAGESGSIWRPWETEASI